MCGGKIGVLLYEIRQRFPVLPSFGIASPLKNFAVAGIPSLCILGSPYILGGLEPAGHSCRRVSSVSEDFFNSNVVFHSIASMGSLASFLYAGSSRREEIFC